MYHCQAPSSFQAINIPLKTLIIVVATQNLGHQIARRMARDPMAKTTIQTARAIEEATRSPLNWAMSVAIANGRTMSR